jgi:hypothetical protein
MASSPSGTQRARKSNPRESWDWLRLKIWRLQQRVAASIRGLRRRYGKHVQGIAWKFRHWAKPEQVDVQGGLNEGLTIMGEGIHSTVTRRLAQVARERLESLVDGLVSLKEYASGETCFLCGGKHPSHLCISTFMRTLELERQHQAAAWARVKDTGTLTLDRVDDFSRLAMSKVLSNRARVQRMRGITRLTLLVARRAIRLPTGLVGAVAHLTDDAIYIATGWRLWPTYLRVERVLEKVFPSLTLSSASDSVISECRKWGISTLGSVRVTVALLAVPIPDTGSALALVAKRATVVLDVIKPSGPSQVRRVDPQHVTPPPKGLPPTPAGLMVDEIMDWLREHTSGYVRHTNRLYPCWAEKKSIVIQPRSWRNPWGTYGTEWVCTERCQHPTDKPPEERNPNHWATRWSRDYEIAEPARFLLEDRAPGKPFSPYERTQLLRSVADMQLHIPGLTKPASSSR